MEVILCLAGAYHVHPAQTRRQLACAAPVTCETPLISNAASDVVCIDS